MRTAIGFRAGPEKPPVRFAIFGRRVSMSIAIAVIVLINETISLPAASTARANSAMLVTFGLSLVISGSVVARRTVETTSAASAGSVPNATPPAFTLGQEMLISSAVIPSRSASSRAATSPYSAMVVPQIFTMVAAPTLRRNGI